MFTPMNTTTPFLSPVRSWLGLTVILIGCFAVAAIGSSVTTPEIGGWYATLQKPPFNPPNWIFGPVWTLLYAMMAVAAWLVWRRQGVTGARGALALFVLQLLLNLAWSILFFGLRSPGAALVDILLLWSAILLTSRTFAIHSRPAGLLLLPYLAWVSFAAVLNGWIWWHNPG